jgi:GNAT superfamily N-acetyltransferase
MASPPELEIQPLTPDCWGDLEELFGSRGACAGCWCMWWLLPRREFDDGKGEGNRAAFRGIVSSGLEPGILAYADGAPIGWCAVGPRRRYCTLARSRVLRPVDTIEVWSLVCLFVARHRRRRGVSEALVRGAAEFARERGAGVLEAYPVEPRKERVADAFVYTGLASVFRRLGFVEVARRSPTRPIVRLALA